MSEGENGKDVTRREMAEALAESRAQNAALADLIKSQGEQLAALTAKAAEPAPDSGLLRELADARAQIAQNAVQRAASASQRPTSSDVTLVPYSGLVQATANCCYEHWRNGPIIGDKQAKPPRPDTPGEVFHVEVSALWTDDPFVAIVIKGTREDGVTPIIAPNPDAPTPIDFRFRKIVRAIEDPTPRRASEY